MPCKHKLIFFKKNIKIEAKFSFDCNQVECENTCLTKLKLEFYIIKYDKFRLYIVPYNIEYVMHTHLSYVYVCFGVGECFMKNLK